MQLPKFVEKLVFSAVNDVFGKDIVNYIEALLLAFRIGKG